MRADGFRIRPTGRAHLKTTAIFVGLVLLLTACGGADGADEASESQASGDAETHASASNTDSSEDEPEAAGDVFPEAGSTLTIVVPFAPGGGIDAGARGMAAVLGEQLDISVVVENRDGGGGITGADYVYRQDADGYTLLTTVTPILALSELIQDARFSALEFEPVFGFAEETAAIAIAADSPFETFDDIIAAAEQGERILVAIPGGASAMALQAAVLNDSLPVEFTPVFYEGAAPAATAVQGGEATFTLVGHTSLKQYEGLTPIASIQAERHPNTPDTETLAELGYDVTSISQTRAFWAPPGTPEGTLSSLEDAFRTVVRSAEWSEFADSAGFVTVEYGRSDLAGLDQTAYDLVEQFRDLLLDQ